MSVAFFKKLHGVLLSAKTHHVFLFLILLVWGIRIASLQMHPIPVPAVQDELSNMLGAQTFSMGRLTNPPLLFPDSLKEIHVLDSPTRMTKYPPLMALFMSAGISVFGDAYWGVVLSVSLMVIAAYWAISVWSNKTIAFCAALFLVAIFRAPHYWINSYWGGSHTALASFLIIGAYAKIFLEKKFYYMWLLMLAIVLLAISRPFEGAFLIFGLTIGALVHGKFYFNQNEIKKFLLIALVPCLTIGASYLAAQAYYNYVVTGSAFSLPYTYYTAKYNATPLFFFLKENTNLLSSHYALGHVQQWEHEKFLDFNLGDKTINLIIHFLNTLKIDRLFYSYITIGFVPIFYLFVLFFPFIAHNKIYKKDRLALVKNLPLSLAWYLLILAFLANNWSFPHYIASFFAVTVVLTCTAIHYSVQNSRVAKKILIPSYLVIVTVFFVTIGPGLDDRTSDAAIQRSRIANELLETAGNDIVFVDLHLKTDYQHARQESWVYNPPDIATAPIIWAWHLSPQENAAVINHYKGRKIWYIAPSSMENVIPYSDYKP